MSSSLLRGKQFYCREWALLKLQHWLETRSSGRVAGVLVTGGSGSGKTAFCTEILWPTSETGKSVHLASRCLAYHFCQQEDTRTLHVHRFILGLVEQLRQSPLLQGYNEKLEDPSVQAALEPIQCERDPDETFKKAVLLPLLDLTPPSQSLLLLADSLDAGPVPGKGEGHIIGKSSTIAELLCSHQQLFPSWLLLVCSVRRQNKPVSKMFSGFRKLCLDDLRKAHIVRDVQQYILWRLDKEGALRRHLTRETADMLNQLHIKSNGCFLFLERVLDGVADNFVAIREIRDIPGTLNGLYLWLCQRLFPRKLFSKVQPLLNVLLASPRPLILDKLFTAVWTKDTTLTFTDFQHKLEALSKLLVDGPCGSKLLFHGSFAEWLTDVKYCTQKYLCNVPDGHAMLAMSLSLRSLWLSPEGVCELASHLVNSNIHQDNPTLLALWMVCIDVPPFSRTSDIPEPFLPAPIQQEVLQLLVKAGVYPSSSNCSHNYTFDVGCAASGGVIRKALEREDSVRVLLENGASVNQVDPVDGRTLLASASHAGSTDVVSLLLSKGADPTIQDYQGQTPLMLAARQGHARVLQCLLEWAQKDGRRLDLVDHADREGWTALRSAAWGGHAEAVRILLEAGAEVDGSDSEGRTALRAAAWGGHEEILQTLLDHGAQVDHPDKEGRTPLIAAAYMGHWEAVELLLDHGAVVDLQDSDGRTALSVAALCVPSAAGRGYGEVVSLLLERGADPGHKDHDGMTPLLLAAYEGHAEVVELLLEAGADVDEPAGPQDGGGNSCTAVTPLLAASSMGHKNVVYTLLFWGAAVDAIDGEGRTALSLAAARGSVEVVRMLLDRGLDENHRDDLGWTPLHAGACEGHRGVCAALTERGSVARVTELDNEGRTPLILAAQEGHLDCVKLLLDRRSLLDHRGYDGRSALSAAALEGHADVVELLLKRGSNADVKDAEGRPLLYLLMLERILSVAKVLLEKDNIPLESKDAEGRTALHVSCWQGHLESVNLLLSHKADANAVDAEGRPPLHSSAWQGHAAVARLLIETGNANVDQACSQQGATALCIAAQEGHTEVVQILLEKGANPNHADHYGRTPIKVAGKRGNSKIVKMLESYGAPTYCGFLPPSPLSQQKITSTLRTQSSGITSTSSGSPGGASVEHKPPPSLQQYPQATSPSGSPESTTERSKSLVVSENSLQSSKASSSTYHSLATAHTVPVDSLSFTQQIQQHSLPRSRSRHSTLVSPNSTLLSNGIKSKGNQKNVDLGAIVASSRHWINTPLSNLGLEQITTDGIKKSPTNKIGVIPSSVSEKVESPQHTGGRWNSVMASLGVTPKNDSPSHPLRTRDSPPLGYHLLTEPTQQKNGDEINKPTITSPLPPACTNTRSPSSALLPKPMIAITTLDPQLNLKQAIKLQFEGPTSALNYKRETPL